MMKNNSLEKTIPVEYMGVMDNVPSLKHTSKQDQLFNKHKIIRKNTFKGNRFNDLIEAPAKPIKDKKLQLEIHLLALSQIFCKLYFDYGEKTDDIMVDAYYKSLMKVNQAYAKYTVKATNFYHNILSKVAKILNKKKNKKADEIEAHGLGLSIALVLLHKEIKNRKLFVDYKTASVVFEDLEDYSLKTKNKQEKENIQNAFTVASMIFDLLEKEILGDKKDEQ